MVNRCERCALVGSPMPPAREPERRAAYRKLNEMEKRSWLDVAPGGGEGNGEERRTAARAALSSDALPLPLTTRA